jgi:hypothetical protein
VERMCWLQHRSTYYSLVITCPRNPRVTFLLFFPCYWEPLLCAEWRQFAFGAPSVSSPGLWRSTIYPHIILAFFFLSKHTFVCPGMGYSLTAATSMADSCLAYLGSFVGLTWYTRLFPHHSLPSTRLALYRPNCASGGPNPGTFS